MLAASELTFDASAFQGIAAMAALILGLMLAGLALLAPYYIYRTFQESRRARLALERLVQIMQTKR